MGNRSPVLRISLGLVALTCSILLSLDLLGIVPSSRDAQLRDRVQIVENLAVQVASALSSGKPGAARSVLLFAVQRHPELLSAGVRTNDGKLTAATPRHSQLWQPEDPSRSTPTHASLTLASERGLWGRLEVRFEELPALGVLERLWGRPIVRLTLLLGAAAFFAYLLYLRRTLQHLDPSAVIPTRVQAALDVMTEGVLLLDERERIVLANSAFAARTGRTPESLLGLPASSLGWQIPGTDQTAQVFPWLRAIRDSEAPPDEPLALANTVTGESHTFMVKGAPVLDGWGRAKGAIATLDDVTELERKTEELGQALIDLAKSRDEIRLQNEALEALAKQDPLTGISNRRHVMDQLEPLFQSSRAQDKPLCAVMVDIDHFKRVNDTHGHGVGDGVIRRVAKGLSAVAHSADSVCRYGGEEFLLIMPGIAKEAAAGIAERLRDRIDSPGFAQVPVTASFGVASIADGAESAEELISQADAALYASKAGGRNRVTCWSAALSASSQA